MKQHFIIINTGWNLTRMVSRWRVGTVARRQAVCSYPLKFSRTALSIKILPASPTIASNSAVIIGPLDDRVPNGMSSVWSVLYPVISFISQKVFFDFFAAEHQGIACSILSSLSTFIRFCFCLRLTSTTNKWLTTTAISDLSNVLLMVHAWKVRNGWTCT